MSRLPAFTPHEDSEIAARYDSGQTAQSLATEYGVTVPTIHRAIERAGGAIRPPGRPSTVFSDPENCRTITTRYLAGDSCSQLGREYGVPAASVWSWLKARKLLRPGRSVARAD